MGIGILEAVQEEEGSTEDVRRGIAFLKEKLRRHAKITLAWKTKYRDENRLVNKMKTEREVYLQMIQSQLLVFESQLKKSRKELDLVVEHKDGIIRRQHQLICSLTLALIKKEGHQELKKILPGLQLEKSLSDNSKNKIYETISRNNFKNEKNFDLEKVKQDNGIVSSSKMDFESLNDSDSAIMMEDAYDSLIALPVGKGEVKVMRSVSDALEIISRGVSLSLCNKPCSGNTSHRRSGAGHGSLSSTPSCSSEDSDDSPPSSNMKHADILEREQNYSDELLRLNADSCPSISLSSSTPKYRPLVNICDRNSQDNWRINSLEYSPVGESCETLYCQSPSCFHCNSGSTTPLASPSQTPFSPSPSTSPPTSPTEHKAFCSPSRPTELRELEDLSKYDSDSEATLSDGQSEEGDSRFSKHILSSPTDEVATDKRSFFGSFEKLNNLDTSRRRLPREEPTIQVTYNRVMSNHRSVTKPKDVKYKRINKAKSRSLEELRGKLKLFDGKQSISIDLEGQSNA